MRSFQFVLYLLFSILSVFISPASFCQKNEELVLHKIDEQNGLSDNNVQCIYKDKNDFVWIGTASGLNLMNGSDMTVFKHEIANPNSISNNNITAITGDKNGLLWLGTLGGVYSYDPATFADFDFEHPTDVGLLLVDGWNLQGDNAGFYYAKYAKSLLSSGYKTKKTITTDHLRTLALHIEGKNDYVKNLMQQLNVQSLKDIIVL